MVRVYRIRSRGQHKRERKGKLVYSEISTEIIKDGIRVKTEIRELPVNNNDGERIRTEEITKNNHGVNHGK